jgi:hypothetical protein
VENISIPETPWNFVELDENSVIPIAIGTVVKNK